MVSCLFPDGGNRVGGASPLHSIIDAQLIPHFVLHVLCIKKGDVRSRLLFVLLQCGGSDFHQFSEDVAVHSRVRKL